MNKPTRIGLAILTIFLLLGGLLWFVSRLGSPETLILEVSGEPGRKIAGTAEVNGTSRPLAGTLPARFEYRGSRIAYTVIPAAGDSGGQILVKATVKGLPSECVGSGVKGFLTSQGIPLLRRTRHGIGSLSDDEVAQLAKDNSR